VYVKGGSVLPLATVTASSQSPGGNAWTVRVYGDGSLPWSLNDGGPALSWDAQAERGRLRQSGSLYSVAEWVRMK